MGLIFDLNGQRRDVANVPPGSSLLNVLREDLGDDDRVGEKIRCFEADLTRRPKPVLA